MRVDIYRPAAGHGKVRGNAFGRPACKRVDFILPLPGQVLLAFSSGDLLSASGPLVLDHYCRRGSAAGRHHCHCAQTGQTISVSHCRLVVVYRHSGARYRTGSGRLAIDGRSLRVYSFDWVLCDGGVGCQRDESDKSDKSDWSDGPQRNTGGRWHPRPAALRRPDHSPTWLLERQ